MISAQDLTLSRAVATSLQEGSYGHFTAEVAVSMKSLMKMLQARCFQSFPGEDEMGRMLGE